MKQDDIFCCSSHQELRLAKLLELAFNAGVPGGEGGGFFIGLVAKNILGKSICINVSLDMVIKIRNFLFFKSFANTL